MCLYIRNYVIFHLINELKRFNYSPNCRIINICSSYIYALKDPHMFTYAYICTCISAYVCLVYGGLKEMYKYFSFCQFSAALCKAFKVSRFTRAILNFPSKKHHITDFMYTNNQA